MTPADIDPARSGSWLIAWELAKHEPADACARAALDDTLAVRLAACRLPARELAPFLPAAARRIELALASGDIELGRRLFVGHQRGRGLGGGRRP